MNPYRTLADESLMELYKNGSEQAFEVLYSRHKGKVYGYLTKRLGSAAEVDDVFQRVFMKIHKSKDSYDPKFTFMKWVYVICRSELIDFQRKHTRYNEVLGQANHLQSSDQAVGMGNTNDISDLLSSSILSDNERQAVGLRYLQDKEFAQISQLLETSEANARKLISRALKKLRSFYGSHYGKKKS